MSIVPDATALRDLMLPQTKDSLKAGAVEGIVEGQQHEGEVQQIQFEPGQTGEEQYRHDGKWLSRDPNANYVRNRCGLPAALGPLVFLAE